MAGRPLNLTVRLSGQGVFQAAVTAGVKALRQACAWHVGQTARRSMWLEQSGRGGESEGVRPGSEGRGTGAGRTGQCGSRGGLGLSPSGRGGREPGSGRYYGPHPVLRNRKLWGKPSQARKGSRRAGGSRGQVCRVGAKGRETAEGQRTGWGSEGEAAVAAGWRP